MWYNYPVHAADILSTAPSQKCDFSHLENLVMSPHRSVIVTSPMWCVCVCVCVCLFVFNDTLDRDNHIPLLPPSKVSLNTNKHTHTHIHAHAHITHT